MRLPPGVLGATAGPVEHEIDARWLMAYAAGLGDGAPVYLDSARVGGVGAHPLFPVCYEWPAAVALRAALPPAVAARAVHLTHDLVIHRAPRPGDRLRTTARVTAATVHRSGAFVLTRFDTVDAGGAPVSTTDYGSLHRGVAGDVPVGPARQARPGIPEPAPASPAAAWTTTLPLPATLAHVYTECARIWNPIHTDRVAALAAGLQDAILHGTATLALAVSEIVRREAGGDPTRVRRIAAGFGAMVRLPSTLRVQGRGVEESPDGPGIEFAVLTEDGSPAIRDGWLLLTSR